MFRIQRESTDQIYDIPSCYWPLEDNDDLTVDSTHWLCVDDLLLDLELAEKWGTPPYEISGRRSRRWRRVYRLLLAYSHEARLAIQVDEKLKKDRKHAR